MKVLVTGHHGYIGSVAGPMLVEAGHDVTGLDTFFYEGCDLVPDTVEIPALRMDLREVTPETLEGFEGIVHFAALSNDPLGSSTRSSPGRSTSAAPWPSHGPRRKPG